MTVEYYSSINMNNVTLILQAVGRGERQASEELLPLVYEELRQLAAAECPANPPGIPCNRPH